MLRALAKFFPFIYIPFTAAAELITFFLDISCGFFCHAVIMFALAGHAVFLYPAEKNSSYLLMSIALAPLIRIISLYAPLSSFNFLQRFTILIIPIFFAALVLISFQHLNEQRKIKIRWLSCSHI